MKVICGILTTIRNIYHPLLLNKMLAKGMQTAFAHLLIAVALENNPVGQSSEGGFKKITTR